MKFRTIRLFVASCALAVPALAGEGLGELSLRLRDGDRAAIDDLLARTRPSSIELVDSNARIAALRADIDRLNARRSARPVHALVNAKPVQRAESAAASVHALDRADALRESRAWLRAGEAELALRALPARDASASDEESGLYFEARALEKLGRRSEALEIHRRLAASAATPTMRARAASDVAHLEWRERMLGGRP